MKTLEEKAKEYSKKVSNGKHYRDLEIGFIAGYNAAQEWISVDDELPEIKFDIYFVLCKDINGNYHILEIEDSISYLEVDAYNITHWRPINND